MSDIWLHKKSNILYLFLCEATIEATGESVVVYRGLDTGETWVRPSKEFYDGRFESQVDMMHCRQGTYVISNSQISSVLETLRRVLTK